MRPGTIFIVIAALVLVAVQIFLFSGHNKGLTSLPDQVSNSRELDEQLRNTLESNANLNRLATKLHKQVEELLSESNTVASFPEVLQADHTEHTWRETHKSLRGSGQILGGHEAQGESNVLKQPQEAQQRRVYPSGNEAEACIGGPHNTDGVVAAVVVVVFNRPDYLRRHMASLLSVHGSDPANRQKFPLFISQDGTPVHDETQQQAQSYEEVSYLHHKELVKPVLKHNAAWEKIEYYRIANHYRYIFKTFFDCFLYPRLIILEDDMELAPDFFTYFEALAPLLDEDERLFCISSWNDHGQEKFVRDTRRLYRTDFFPGLGWMLRRQLWDEMREGWPEGWWDDWMRDNSTRKGRHCIRPEVCRNYNFGRQGSSKGMYFDAFLAPTRLNDDDVPWLQMDLSYLKLPRYDDELRASLEAAPIASSVSEAKAWQGEVRLQYKSQEEFEQLAVAFAIMKEWRDGVPRAAYHGVVTIWFKDARVYIEPHPDFPTGLMGVPVDE